MSLKKIVFTVEQVDRIGSLMRKEASLYDRSEKFLTDLILHVKLCRMLGTVLNVERRLHESYQKTRKSYGKNIQKKQEKRETT